jgi:hypothetical protein
MRILLVEPPISPFDVPTGTFGLPPAYHLERLAGGLVKDHDVRIFDMRIDPSLSEELDDFEPDMVGCSCVAANSHLAKEVLWKAKQQHPGTVTVIGGHHPSLSPESCSENYIDFVVIGEGEASLKTDRLDLIDFYHAVIPTRLPLEEFYEEFRNLYKKAYPFTGFVKSVLQKKTVLSPSMFRKTCQFKKRMASLQEHHRTKAPTAPDLY